MTTATAQIERLNLRRIRAQHLASAIMNVIVPFLGDDARRGRIIRAMDELLATEGVEVISDMDRARAGLPPRGPDGWTPQELVALESIRLHAMLDMPRFMLEPELNPPAKP